MRSFRTLEYQVKTDGSSRYVVFRGTFPGYELPHDAPKPAGLLSVWFVLTERELSDIARKPWGEYSDGAHKLNVSGDRWTFFDMEFPRADRGVAETRYAHVSMPREVVRLLLRWARQVWAKQEAIIQAAGTNGPYEARHPEPAVLDLANHAARWEARYGQGKGNVRIVADERTARMIDACRGKGNFDAVLSSLETMARNQTSAIDETQDLPIYRDTYRDDDPCFTWRAAGLFGGLVNHGKDGAHEWSLHT